MNKLARRSPQPLAIVSDSAALTFNFAGVLPGRASSRHSQRAYYRWVERYLADMAGIERPGAQPRELMMAALPVREVCASLSAPQVRAWLGALVREGHSRQGINQARASLVTLAELLAEAELLPDHISAGIGNVRPPSAADGQRPGRWLAMPELQQLMQAARDIATSENMRLRNHVVVMLLCTMALRREELASARWGDLSLQNRRAIMRVHGKGKKAAVIDLPRPVISALDSWRKALIAGNVPVAPETPLVRRIWKGGRISKWPLTADGIWWVIGDAAQHAGIGHVAPHDLRRSVAGALNESGVPIEKISRLLRHANVAVTERYLSKLPQPNQGAVLMSDLLGLEHDADDWLNG